MLTCLTVGAEAFFYCNFLNHCFGLRVSILWHIPGMGGTHIETAVASCGVALFKLFRIECDGAHKGCQHVHCIIGADIHAPAAQGAFVSIDCDITCDLRGFAYLCAHNRYRIFWTCLLYTSDAADEEDSVD